jgi:hypothetical protein
MLCIILTILNSIGFIALLGLSICVIGFSKQSPPYHLPIILVVGTIITGYILLSSIKLTIKASKKKRKK